MLKISIFPHWQLHRTTGESEIQSLDTSVLLRLLAQIQASGSIASAGRATGLSYRHVWGLLREAEQLFGIELLVKKPGRGTQLSQLAQTLLLAEERIRARLSPTLESLASELESEIRKAVASDQQPLRLFASHGFAVATLLEWINTAAIAIELRYRNSTEALAALARRECDLAGFHVPIGEFQNEAVERYMQWLNPDKHVLIQLATRRQGLFVAPGNPKRITGLADLKRRQVRFVNRQEGSGTRMLLELMLRKANIATADIGGFQSTEFTHAAVAAYIASGMADVGVGVETAARRFGLDFVPLLQERYFFAVEAEALKTPGAEEIVGILQSPEFGKKLDELPGYDGAHTGKIMNLRQAFLQKT